MSPETEGILRAGLAKKAVVDESVNLRFSPHLAELDKTAAGLHTWQTSRKLLVRLQNTRLLEVIIIVVVI